MEIETRNRSELKTYFVKNAVPTEGNFSEFIDAMLNQKDDGIAKEAGNPLAIEAAGDATSQKKAINFYESFADTAPAWVLALSPRSDPNNAATVRAGFSVNDAAGNSRFFIDKTTGFVGLGTVDADLPLTLRRGDTLPVGITQYQVGGSATMELTTRDGSGNQATRVLLHGNSDTPDIRFLRGPRGTETDSIYVEGNTGHVGIGTGTNAAARLQVGGGAIMPAVGNSASAGIQFPTDAWGGSGDGAWLRYYSRGGEATTLELGIANDFDDHIALMPSGNVGVNLTDPQTPLHVVGGTDASPAGGGFVVVGNTSATNLVLDNDEIMARNNGQLSTLFVQHNGGDFLVHGGVDTHQRFIVKDDGKVGIGTTSPAEELTVNGTVRAGRSNFYIDMVHTGDVGSGIINSFGGQGNLLLRIDNNTKMTIESGGNVGVGVDDPQYRLHVGASARAESDLLVGGDLSFDNVTRQMVNLWDTSYGIGIQNITAYFRTAGNFAWYMGGTHSDTELDPGDGTVRMVIDSSGKVGIGTSSPGTSLSVIGVVRGANGVDETRYVEIGHGGSNGYVNRVGAGNLDFRLEGSNKMSIKSDGTVGIGTTNTQGYQLRVSGTGKFTGSLDVGEALGVSGTGTFASLDVNGTGDFVTLNVSGSATASTLNVNGGGEIGGELEVAGDGYFGGDTRVDSDLRVGNNLFFDNVTRQMINLWGTDYGIGIQSRTQYFRTADNFAWYQGGTHSNSELNPGGGSVRMTIESEGKVTAHHGISVSTDSRTSPMNADGGFYRYSGQTYIVVDDNLYIRDSGSGATQFRFHFNTNNGQAIASGGFLPISDASAKTGVRGLGKCLDKVLALAGVRFNWKDPGLDQGGQIGLIAQEVEKVFPELVALSGDKKCLNYSGLIAPLIEAVRELQEQIETLKAAVAA